MPRGPGRDQMAPMERIVRIITLLNETRAAVSTDDLIKIAGYPDEKSDSAKRMLSRDIAQLNHYGWDIRNVGAAGDIGRYQMFARDNRLQVYLTPAHRAELNRAAMALGRPELARQLGARSTDPNGSLTHVVPGPAPKAFDVVLRAVSRRCRLRFAYKDVERDVHPYAVHPGPSGWYLRAREEGGDRIKEFVIERMRNVVLDRPETAESPADARRPQLDPLSWQQDPPIDVVLEVGVEHLPQVEQLLGPATEKHRAGDATRLTYSVTHRAAFRWRLYELGPRVRIVGPDAFRDEVRRELAAIVEAGT